MDKRALLLLLFAMLSIQFGAAMAKSLFTSMSPIGVSTLRLIFASAILLLIWRPWRRKDSKNWKMLFAYGASLGLMNLSFYLSLARIPLGLAVAFEFTGPLMLAVITSKRVQDLFWVLCAAAGVVCLSPELFSSSPGSLDAVGVGLAVLAGFFWALYIWFAPRASKGISAGDSSAIGMLIAAIVVLPVGLTYDWQELANISLWPLGFAVALFSSAIPYSLEMIAIQKIPTKSFSILMSMEPVVACLSGFLILSESLTTLQLLAIALIIIASLGTSLRLNEGKEGL